MNKNNRPNKHWNVKSRAALLNRTHCLVNTRTQMWKIVPAPSLTHCLRMIMTLQTLGDEKKKQTQSLLHVFCKRESLFSEFLIPISCFEQQKTRGH